jgi:glycosyltransferase involved in cell wall biosynthesis
VTTVSRWLARETEAIVSGVRASVAPMPVATELFSPGGERDPNRLLFVGASRAEGHRRTHRSAGAMRHPASLDVVGDGPLRRRRSRACSGARAGDRVRWLGALPQPKLVDLYRRAAGWSSVDDEVSAS